MKLLLFVVNYCADEPLKRLLESVGRARARSPETRVTVYVLDNSLKDRSAQSELAAALAGFDFQVTVEHAKDNLGYFGGLPIAQSVGADADCVIYANPDIVLHDDFFLRLEEPRECVGLLAPRILPLHGGADLNPKYARRLPRAKLERLEWIYSHLISYRAYNALGTLRERGRRSFRDLPRQRIYCPHGSIFVFTDVGFFCALPPYPCFLFGEELFVAEEARLAGVEIWYEPDLRVTDIRHASVSLLASERRRRSYHESVTHILRQYYEGDSDSVTRSTPPVNGPRSP
jgi:GT2 family glycosyltransferase